MHQYFILVLISILTTLKYSLKPQMKMVILCMIALFLLATRPVGAQNIKVIHECQFAKGMRWGMHIVERGVRGISPE